MPPLPLPPPVPLSDDHARVVHATSSAALPPLNTTYYFDQLIDHGNPGLGTFKQRYWTTWNFYEPGGPIILSTPGESNAERYTGYLTNRTINGQIAQQEKGAAIVLEHRYYGLSNPFPDLTVKSLKYHTIQQGVDDLEYFAKHVKLPMPGGDKVAPGQAPWILVGGSYAGALTAFTMVKYPDVFQAGYASSGVVESIFDFWRYFEPIREGMPKNCSNDVQAAVAAFD
ncbi:serine carboxypeptidase S28-domain-containing protein, partial [Amylostereum chailletii]